MRPLRTLPFFFVTLSFSFSSLSAKEKKDNTDFDVAKASGEIDALVEGMLSKQSLKPNDAIDDATFLRRAYLDIAGRVPTIEEAENFHGSDYPRKRQQLISDLLEGDGHMSHSYNFWADVLRINSGLGVGGQQAEAAYQLWVKEAIRENKPYDQFVRSLISGKGMIWENGAVGYYIRDRGMPLDNMSNTVRVFLGTRLECAQCHNHPFDKWTQMDYFQMAAFSYGMDARSYDSPNRVAMGKAQKEERNAIQAKFVGNAKFPQIKNEAELKRYTESEKYETYLKRLDVNDSQFRTLAKKSMAAFEEYDHSSRGVNNAINELYNPLRYVTVKESEKTLKLPHDYQYSDSKPLAPVSGKTMFGADIDLENIDDSVIGAYADWMVSKENPTFTRVIANRLWKRVFGHGVFEPVDELTEQTQISNPELLTYLEKMMQDLDFDMRKYMEVLYNTKSYQRAANSEEMVMGEHYYFAGPLLRRMSAEQIWDSIVVLALPEADSYRPRVDDQLASVEKVKRIYKAIEGRSEEDFIAMVSEIGKVYDKLAPREEKTREASAAALAAGDKEKLAKLRTELNAIRGEARKAVETIGYKNVGEKVKGSDLLAAMGMTEMQMGMGVDEPAVERAVMTKLPKPEFPKAPAELTDKKDQKAWASKQKQEYQVYTKLIRDLARASELESPARRGHFLREFGQSDREVIENAGNNASVPQALNLLNGSMVEALTNQFAVFGRRIQGAGNPDEKIRMIFQAMLTREPTDREMSLAMAEVESSGDDAYSGIVWALLNTQQFIFVQ